MGEWLSLFGVLLAPLLAGSGSLLFRSNRLRKSTRAELDIATMMTSDALAGRALRYSLDRKVANLAVTSLVPHPVMLEIWLVVAAILGIACIGFAQSAPTNPILWLGVFAYSTALVFLFLLVTKVAYLRRRQVRAIGVGRESGYRFLNTDTFTTRQLLDRRVVLPEHRSRRTGGRR